MKILYLYVILILPIFFTVKIVNYFIFIENCQKVYTNFMQMCVTGRMWRDRPHKVYIFLFKITSCVDRAMDICLFVGTHKSQLL